MAQGNTIKWASLGIVAAVLLGLGWIVGIRPVRDQEQTDTQIQEEVQQTSVLKAVSYDGQDGKTALELLQAGRQVETQQSELGVLVIAIDGVGGDANAFWLYYVNGEAATMGADKYVTKNGETIEWRYEQF